MSRSQQGNESYPQGTPAPETARAAQAPGGPQAPTGAAGPRPAVARPAPAPQGSHTVVLPPVPAMPTLRSPAPGPSPELLRAAAGPQSPVTEPTPAPLEQPPGGPEGFAPPRPAAPPHAGPAGAPAPYVPAAEPAGGGYPPASDHRVPGYGRVPAAPAYPPAPAGGFRAGGYPSSAGHAPSGSGYGSTGYPSVDAAPGQGQAAEPWHRRLSLESPVMLGAMGVVAIGLVVAIMLQFMGDDPSRPAASDTGNANQTTATERTVQRSEITARASSTQDPEKNGVTYSVDNTLDGDPSTAWNSNGRKDGPGEGMSLTYTFDDPIDLSRITLRNGYQKIRTRANGQTLDLYKLNKRVRKIQVVTDKGSWTWDIEDSKKPQEFAEDFGAAAWVRLEVLETYRSARYKDLAVSEVTFTAAG